MRFSLKIYLVLSILALLAVGAFYGWPQKKSNPETESPSLVRQFSSIAARVLPASWFGSEEKPEKETALPETPAASLASSLQPKKPKKLDTNLVKDFIKNNPEFADKPIARKSESSITFQDGDKFVTQIFSFPIHYQDDKGEWKEIDTALQYFPETKEYGTLWSKTRIKPDGTVRIIDDSQKTLHTQKTSRVGKFNEDSKTFAPIINSFPDGIISGDKLVRKFTPLEKSLFLTGFTHELMLTGTGLKENLVVSEPVEGSPKEWLMMETNFGPSRLFPDGWISDFKKADRIFPPPIGTDADGKEIELKRYAKYTGGVQYLYTGIEISDLTQYKFPVVLDPDYLDSTNDGYIYGTGDWAPARLTAFAPRMTYTYLKFGPIVMDVDQFEIHRVFLKFDTSGIPDGDTITQVNLKMVSINNSLVTHFDAIIVKQNWSAQDPITISNKEAAYDNCLAGTVDDNIWQNTANVSTNTQYASGNLSTAWVNKSGSTYYSLISSNDYNDTEPSYNPGASFAFASQEHATVAYRPILTVVHAPSPNSPTNSPGTVVDDATVGTIAWTNPDNAKVSDNVYATAASSTEGVVTSHYLKATNFGFAIPAGATINGILVEIERKASSFAGNNKVNDSSIKIVKSDGSIGTTNKSTGGTWLTFESYLSYGGSSDLWGESWGYADINDADFGVVLSVALENPAACFIEGTQVNTPTGVRNIEDLVDGDEIISFNENGEMSISKIVNTIHIFKRHTLVAIETVSGKKVIATDDQIFFAPNGFIAAFEIKVGDKLFIYDNGQVIEQKVKSIEEKTVETTVYGLSLDKEYLFSANNFIVHNAITASVDHIRITVDYTPPPDPTWVTGAADFKIYESGSLTWGAGTLVCSGTLTDDNASTINCGSGKIKDNTQYRVQVIQKNVGTGAANMQGVSDYVDHKNVKSGWAGTSPTLGNCGFYDVGTDDGSTTCTAAWNATNDVRITNTGAGNVVIGATTGTEGFMYLITTGSDASSYNTASYFDTSIDGYAEDSSKISVSGPGRTTFQGIIEMGGSVTAE